MFAIAVAVACALGFAWLYRGRRPALEERAREKADALRERARELTR